MRLPALYVVPQGCGVLRFSGWRGILVTVMVCPAFRTCPFPDVQILHCPVLITAAAAYLAGREILVCPYKLPAVPSGLVFLHLQEPAPGAVLDPPGHVRVVFHQELLYLQVFHADDGVFPDDAGAELLLQVLPDIGYPFMEPGHLDALAFIAPTAPCFSEQPALLMYPAASWRFPMASGLGYVPSGW